MNCDQPAAFLHTSFAEIRGSGDLCASDVEVEYVNCDHPAAFRHASSSEAWGQWTCVRQMLRLSV